MGIRDYLVPGLLEHFEAWEVGQLDTPHLLRRDRLRGQHPLLARMNRL